MSIKWPWDTQTVELPWGGETLAVEVPATWNLVYPERSRNTEQTRLGERETVRASLDAPYGDGILPIKDYDLAGKKIVIVVDDNTRPTPAYRFFDMILSDLEAAGASPADITLLPALGIHTPMTEQEMVEKVGAANLAGVSWENHNAFDKSANAFFGTTTRGTEVYLNSHLVTADFVILIGLIEPHLMAGFGGGMKNILPGVAFSDTIGTHHEILTDDPLKFNRVGMMPENNSFRLDFEEVRQMVLNRNNGILFCVNVVLGNDKTILASFAGDPIAAHRGGIAFSYNQMGLHLDQQVDGIITNSFPMDINFKQSMKCIGNSLPALKDGGAVMGFLRAENGTDDIPLPEKMSLPLWLVRIVLRVAGPKYVYDLVKLFKKDADVEDKFLYYYTMQLVRAYELFLYVPTLTKEEAEALFFFDYIETVEELVRKAVFKIGLDATVAVFPEGGATFPIIGQ